MAIQRLTKNEIIKAQTGKTKVDLINAEILKHQRKILAFQQMKRDVTDNEILKVCPSCNTLNLHWNVDNNSWTCSFC